MTHQDHTAALRDLAKFRESFVVAVGDKSPFAKQALKLADDAIAAPAHPSQQEDDERDAARYRLLRRGQHWSVIDGIGNTLRAETLDTAIDAMSAAQGDAAQGGGK